MPSERIPPDIRAAAARITAELSEGRPVQSDAPVNTFIGMCEALRPERSAIDIVSALRPSVRRELESIALRRFQRRLRPRAHNSNATTASIPRAITELRSAARLWRMSTLVLIAEFADAPVSDNFWRTVAKLARCSGGRDWPAVRGRLHAERDRRQLDVLARRKGVSRTQPWTIPDVEAVLAQLQEQEQEADVREIGKLEDWQQERVLVTNGIHRTTSQQYSSTTLRSHGRSTPQRPQRQQKPPDRLTIRRVQQTDTREEAPEVSKGASFSDRRAQTIMWPLAVGWWLWDDIMHRLCSSLAQLQPGGFTAVDPMFSNLAWPSTAVLSSLPELTTENVFIVPFFIKTPTHWALALISRAEKLVSVFDPLPSRHSRTAATAALERCFSRVLPEHYLPDWAIVARSCQLTHNGVDSGVVVVITVLYCIIRRPMPSNMDIWLWRRLLACYLSRMSEDPEEAEIAKDVAEIHNAIYGGEVAAEEVNRGIAADIKTSLIERRAALKDDAAEARLAWLAAADLMSHAEVNTGIEICARQKIQKSQRAVTAVLDEIDWMLACLSTN